MVKKFLLIILLTIYSAATFGVGVKQFYCCNKLKSTSITFTTNTQEKCKVKGMKGGCCKTKFSYHKVKDTHVAADQVQSPLPELVILPISTSHFVSELTFQHKVTEQNNGPPLHNGLPLYLFDCVYRI